MQAQAEFHVSLIILDDDDFHLPDEITKETGISPSAMWHKGEIRPKSSLRHKDNGWELNSPLPLEAPLVAHITALLNMIMPAQRQLQVFTNRCYSLLACAVYFGEEMPEIHLDNNLIKQLAALNLQLDIDLYCIE